MTPPVRPEWYEAQHATLASALLEAAATAMLMDREHVVVIRIENGHVGFDVMMRESFAAIMALPRHTDIAVVATVQPDGTRSLDSALLPAKLFD